MDKNKDEQNNEDRVNGLRVIELALALFWLTDRFSGVVGKGTITISTVGSRTKNEQLLVGISHVLSMVYPYAVELTMKCLYPDGEYPRSHNLYELFDGLNVDVKETSRYCWRRSQEDEDVDVQDRFKTVDNFLKAHARDFERIRYYVRGDGGTTQTTEFKIVLLSLVVQLALKYGDETILQNFKNAFPEANMADIRAIPHP